MAPVMAVVMALATAGLAGCKQDAPSRAAPPATPGERPIELLVPTDAETLDPRYATDAVAMRTTRLVHAGLVQLDPDTLSPVPYLADRFAWQSPTALRVELRPGLRFHSGAPLTARDVVATLRAFASPTVGSRHARVVEPIAEAHAEGELTVVVQLRRPHATLLTDLELPILREDEAAGAPRADGSLDGLGPYVVARRIPGEIALAPAGGGALARPAHAVTIRTVHDENARALRMLAGRADLVVSGISPTLLPALAADAADDETGRARALHVRSRAGANLTYMLARADRGPLADPRVRRAIARAIDRERIATTLLAGHATVASTLLPELHWAHTPGEAIEFDPADAKRRLAEASASGSGAPLRLSLLTSTDRLRGTIARVIAQELAEVGITLDVVPLELGTLLARLGAGDFELATLQLPELTEPNVLRVFLHSTSIPPAGANRGRVRDEELDRLLDQGARSVDLAERKAIYAGLEQRVREMAWLIPLWHEDQVAVASTRAAAFVPSAEGRWLDLATLP